MKNNNFFFYMVDAYHADFKRSGASFHFCFSLEFFCNYSIVQIKPPLSRGIIFQTCLIFRPQFHLIAAIAPLPASIRTILGIVARCMEGGVTIYTGQYPSPVMCTPILTSLLVEKNVAIFCDGHLAFLFVWHVLNSIC